MHALGQVGTPRDTPGQGAALPRRWGRRVLAGAVLLLLGADLLARALLPWNRIWENYKLSLLREPAPSGGYLRYHPGADVVSSGVRLRFNAIGMRDDELPFPKAPGVFRVLCLGDSHTLGPGVAQEAIWPARLRAELGDPAIEVAAAGVAGWNTIEEQRFLEEHAARLAPDLVVLLYVNNDSEPVELPDPPAPRPAPSWAARLHRFLVWHDPLYERAATYYLTRLAPMDPVAARRWTWTLSQGAAAFGSDAPGWRDSRTALEEMASLVRQRGARLAIFQNDQFDQPIDHAAGARLREFGAATGTPVFETHDFYEGRSPIGLINEAFLDPHQNALGYALLAKGIARTLRDAGLVPAPRG